MHPYPDFLIVGLMKAGTTTAYEHLCSHPSVVSAREKELHYFTRDYIESSSDELWAYEYHELLNYNNRTSGRLTGEASPSYIAAAGRIFSFAPRCKIIIMLREPLQRAISQMRQYEKYNYYAKDRSYYEYIFERKDELLGIDIIIDSVKTYERILGFVEKFPEENICFCSFEYFVENIQEAMYQLFDFLCIDRVKVNIEKIYAATNKVEREEDIKILIKNVINSNIGKIYNLIEGSKINIIPDDAEFFRKY